MAIVVSVLVGAVAGAVAALVCRCARDCVTTSVAVGILGGLLGLASDFWLATGGFSDLAFSEYLASGVGSVVTLSLWMVAQRLFFGTPAERVFND